MAKFEFKVRFSVVANEYFSITIVLLIYHREVYYGNRYFGSRIFHSLPCATVFYSIVKPQVSMTFPSKRIAILFK